MTDDFISLRSQGLYEFNYLLNGILIENLNSTVQKDKITQKQNFFLGNNFENSFFIGHTVIEEKSNIKTIFGQLELAKNLIKDDSQIFIFNRSKNTAGVNILKTLMDKYQNIRFANLNI